MTQVKNSITQPFQPQGHLYRYRRIIYPNLKSSWLYRLITTRQPSIQTPGRRETESMKLSLIVWSRLLWSVVLTLCFLQSSENPFSPYRSFRVTLKRMIHFEVWKSKRLYIESHLRENFFLEVSESLWL